MPVLITGVEDAVGLMTARRLRARDGEVRVFCDLQRPARADAELLRGLGCKVAQGALDDEGHVESALAQVHTVLHLATSPLEPPGALLEAAATVIGGATAVGARRLALLSHPGAADPGGNAWLAALAEAEELAGAAPLETVILRCGPTYGRGAARADGWTGLLAAAGTAAPIRPLWADDVAAVLVAADEERVAGDRDDRILRLSLAGPVEVAAAEFAGELRAAGAGPIPPPPHVGDLAGRRLDLPTGWLGRDGTPPARGLELFAEA